MLLLHQRRLLRLRCLEHGEELLLLLLLQRQYRHRTRLLLLLLLLVMSV